MTTETARKNVEAARDTSASPNRDPDTVNGVGEVVFGFADQIVVALANAGNAFLGTTLLSRGEAGSFLVAVAILNFTTGLSRALLGEAVLTYVARYDAADRRAREQDALATAAVVGAMLAALLVALWAAGPSKWFSDLIWVAPFLPLLVVHDTGRYTLLAARRQGQALTLDLTWFGTQAFVVTIALLSGWRSGGAILFASAVGASAGSLLLLWRGQLNLFKGRVRSWIKETSHLSIWFGLTALVGQGQALLVALVVVTCLTESAYAGLRLMQLAVLQPAQNLVLAMNLLMVPRFSRLAKTGDVVALRRLACKALVLSTGIGAIGILIVMKVAEPILERYKGGAYRDVLPVSLPVALQAAIYIVQIPCISALSGLQRAHSLFLQYLVFALASLTGLITGAQGGSLVCTAWGLTIGAAVGLLATFVFYMQATLTPRTIASKAA